jgi:Zn-dependent peptidase ImmA (M78 family)
LSGVEQDDTREKREAWEDELWTYISTGDGIECPLLDTCELKHNQDIKCFSNEEEKFNTEEIYRFNYKDDIDFSGSPKFNQRRVCLQRSRISQLVTELATKYRNQAWNNILPVPDNLITEDCDNHPIVVRYVPLQASHGAVWKLDDCWIIHLNRRDIPAKQRFTLYHELFHVLAHSEGSCTFKKSKDTVVYFNEVLADHFSANILIPSDLAKQKWAENQDINRMADIFDVPRPVMFLSLRNLGLI